MKKRTLNKLELNKKTISTFDASNVKGGSVTISITCTAGYICTKIIETAIEIAEEITEYTNGD